VRYKYLIDDDDDDDDNSLREVTNKSTDDLIQWKSTNIRIIGLSVR